MCCVPLRGENTELEPKMTAQHNGIIMATQIGVNRHSMPICITRLDRLDRLAMAVAAVADTATLNYSSIKRTTNSRRSSRAASLLRLLYLRIRRRDNLVLHACLAGGPASPARCCSDTSRGIEYLASRFQNCLRPIVRRMMMGEETWLTQARTRKWVRCEVGIPRRQAAHRGCRCVRMDE